MEIVKNRSMKQQLDNASEKSTLMLKFDLRITQRSIVPLLIWFMLMGLYLVYFSRDLSLAVLSIMLWTPFISGMPFVMQEKGALHHLLATFPISRKHVLAGRYLYAAASGFICLFLSEVVVILTLLFFNHPLDMPLALFSLCIGFMLYWLISAIQLPLYFKFAFARSIQIATLFLYFIFMVYYQFSYIFGPGYGNLLRTLTEHLWHPVWTPTFGLVVCALFFGISFNISSRIFVNKDI